jgi:predicted Fe-Mo cluster-binding NifX family protein
MNIIITAQGESLEAQVDPRFGRAKTIILYNTESKEFHIIDNKQNLNAAQGAGIQAAQTVCNTDAEVLITGNCGPKAFKVLDAAEIAVYVEAKGSVADAIKAFENGELKKSDSANVEGHWV